MTDVLGSLLMRESLDHCVKCTICETFCPVSNVTPLFPGPKYVGPQAERFRVHDEPSSDASLDYCSGCGVCTQVCPQGVHIAEINTQARAKLKETHGFKLRDRLIARPTLLGRLGTPAAPIANFTLENRPFRLAVEKVVGVHRDAAVPKFAGRTFQRWAKGHDAPRRGAAPRRLLPRLRDELLRAAAGRDDRRAARAQRHRRRRPQAGLLRPAAAVQRHVRRRAQVRAQAGARGSRRTRAQGVDIVGTSTSCTLMLKREALEILELEDDAELRRGLRARVRHLRVPARDARPRRAQDGLRAARGEGRLPRALPAAGPRDRQAGARADGAHPGARGRRERRDVLRHRRHVRAEEGEVRDRDGGRRRPVPADRRRRARRLRLRLRDVPLAHRGRDGRPLGAPGRDAPPRERAL